MSTKLQKNKGMNNTFMPLFLSLCSKNDNIAFFVIL